MTLGARLSALHRGILALRALGRPRHDPAGRFGATRNVDPAARAAQLIRAVAQTGEDLPQPEGISAFGPLRVAGRHGPPPAVVRRAARMRVVVPDARELRIARARGY